MKKYTLQDLHISEKDITRPTHCTCGVKLRTQMDRDLQLCEECVAELAEYYENV
jgi:hypothetical protein